MSTSSSPGRTILATGVLFEESVPTADDKDELLPLESEDESLLDELLLPLDELLPLESEDALLLANGSACVGSIPREI